MSSLDESDAHRAAEYLEQAEAGETSGATDQAPGGPDATDREVDEPFED